MNDEILNRAKYWTDAYPPNPQEAIDILPELLRAYEELEEKYLNLLPPDESFERYQTGGLRQAINEIDEGMRDVVRPIAKGISK